MNLFNNKSASILTIFASNLLLLIAALVFKWEPLSVFLLYIFETVIIGVLHVLKLVVIIRIHKTTNCKINEAPSTKELLASVLFFIFHFGIFVFVQTALILPNQTNNFFESFYSIKDYLDLENLLFLCLILVINLYSTFRYVFIDNTFKEKTFKEILSEPYPRVFVQQFVVIFGGLVLMFLGLKGIGGLIFIIFFIIMKTFFELLVVFDTKFKIKT